MIGIVEKRSVILSALAVLILMGISGARIHHLTRETEAALQAQAMSPVMALLEAAHREQDDVALQRITHALIKSPSILWAGVVDPKQRRFIVHAEPARIGEPWDAGRLAWRALLGEEESPWGQLTVGFSDSVVSRFHRQLVLWGIICLVGFLALAVVQAGYTYRRVSRLQEEKADAVAALNEFRESLAKSQACQTEQNALAQQCFQSAVEQISRPCFFLDSHQRLAACNSVAALLLGYASAQEALGHSWQDMAVLADCGRILAESIDNPQRTFRITLLQNRLTLDLWSLKPLGGKLPGTWFMLYPPAP